MQRFWQGFDHKNVPAVLGIYTGFAKRNVNISVIPRPVTQMSGALTTDEGLLYYLLVLRIGFTDLHTIFRLVSALISIENELLWFQVLAFQNIVKTAFRTNTEMSQNTQITKAAKLYKT